MPAHGGKRPKAGRKARTPNRATIECKACTKYGPAAVRELAKLAGILPGGKGKAESEQARIAACREILDRAYGKAAQPVQIEAPLDSIDGKTHGIPTRS